MKNIYIAGHKGMVGAALCRHLTDTSQAEVVTASKSELDLSSQADVVDFFAKQKFDEVYLAAAKVGGILANSTYPADFLYENLTIQANVINAAFNAGVKRLLFLGSSCIYPKLASQPINETELLTGALERTNEAYAIAKIAGLKLCQAYRNQHGVDFRAVMPTNLYGPFDRFHPDDSHVIPGLMQRIHEAKSNNLSEVVIWGSGKPMREFLHVDDMAKACIFSMNLERDQYDKAAPSDSPFLNVGTGKDCTIRELAQTLVDVIGYQGQLVFDTNMPDGTPRKLLNTDRISCLGWKAEIDLREGLESTYQWFLANPDIVAQRQ